ncbi:23S rRNA (uracil(1939)-C(5))-methyltransferase [Advenella sp. S44]|uniref:23S rRNA (uracil(1939)-C(5))-methyltransferase RlmD n=1 Tax=Advenella sp. S44 TaxID=1982755 RepID=UPI000C2AFD8B|nr:23S rRNA (uracil(1939)-C(5))-methyltransferase RlmD [Advenella sp. S44]PJX23754.1 23S rRNA (uracil(1939)-C(5))-methyltransferase [Advenella sp. S44]
MQETFTIESLDLEARGVARRDGKAIFVHGALPSEKVTADIIRRKPSYEIAQVTSIQKESTQRVTPRCPSFGICGGCIMQHVDAAAQVAIKQRALEDCFRHIGKMAVPQVLPPLQGPSWGYRYRARLSVRKVIKKGKVLVGFHERKSRYVTDMTECHVLPPYVSDMLVPLRELIGNLSIDEKIPQIEVAVGEATTALLLRHLEPLSASDIEQLDAFSVRHNVVWWLQSKGPDTVKPLHAEQADSLYYRLPQFGLKMPYKPTDFTQVNYFINRSLIAKVINLLQVQPTDRVADLFCGLGNFTLPLATVAREVVGVEGSSTLTDRALEAATLNGLQDKTRFATLNLFEVDAGWLRTLGQVDRMLIDPPRDGAQAVAQALAQLEVHERPARIVYVSCNPATLARDADILVHEGGYKLLAAGAINMFPHTGHVESIAVFEAGTGQPAVEPAQTTA